MNDAQEQALAGLTNLLLTAPESPIRLGSGELSMYRDIATMDQGPGYLNGILSLILNTTAPAARFSEEEQRAVPYFHRSRAAELLALLDTKFPNSTRRPELHAKLLEFYASSGESEAVIRGGREFLASFPNAPQRTRRRAAHGGRLRAHRENPGRIRHLRFRSAGTRGQSAEECRWARVCQAPDPRRKCR